MPMLKIERKSPDNTYFEEIYSTTITQEWFDAILQGGRIVLTDNTQQNRWLMGNINPLDEAINLLRASLEMAEALQELE